MGGFKCYQGGCYWVGFNWFAHLDFLPSVASPCNIRHRGSSTVSFRYLGYFWILYGSFGFGEGIWHVMCLGRSNFLADAETVEVLWFYRHYGVQG